MSSAHHDHAFDGEPTNVLSPDEPRTPTWVPILGASLFALAAVGVLATSDRTTALPTPPTPEIAPETQRVDAPARPAGGQDGTRPTPVARPTPGGRPSLDARPTPVAAPSGTGPGKPVTKEQLEMIRKQVEQARARGALPTAPKKP